MEKEYHNRTGLKSRIDNDMDPVKYADCYVEWLEEQLQAERAKYAELLEGVRKLYADRDKMNATDHGINVADLEHLLTTTEPAREYHENEDNDSVCDFCVNGTIAECYCSDGKTRCHDCVDKWINQPTEPTKDDISCQEMIDRDFQEVLDRTTPKRS